MNIGLNKVLDPACGVLDMCCGARLMYFDKRHPGVLFCDARRGKYSWNEAGKERSEQIEPDLQIDFRRLPAWWSSSFNLVIFDPPHLLHAGEKSMLRAKYGVLDKKTWRDDLRAGFNEAFRVLRPGGTLIFKWSDAQIKLGKILPLAEPRRPLFGAKRGKNTIFCVFYKDQPHTQIKQ